MRCEPQIVSLADVLAKKQNIVTESNALGFHTVLLQTNFSQGLRFSALTRLTDTSLQERHLILLKNYLHNLLMCHLEITLITEVNKNESIDLNLMLEEINNILQQIKDPKKIYFRYCHDQKAFSQLFGLIYNLLKYEAIKRITPPQTSSSSSHSSPQASTTPQTTKYRPQPTSKQRSKRRRQPTSKQRSRRVRQPLFQQSKKREQQTTFEHYYPKPGP